MRAPRVTRRGRQPAAERLRESPEVRRGEVSPRPDGRERLVQQGARLLNISRKERCDGAQVG